MATGTVLDDVGAASTRLVPGTLKGDTLELLLLLAVIELPITELLLSEVGAATAGDIVLELGRTLDDAT